MSRLIVFLFCCALTTCVSSEKNKKFTVVTGIMPIASLIQSIGGNKVRVQSIIPGKVDPHSFSLKPSDAIKIARADVVMMLHPHIDGMLLYGGPQKKSYQLSCYINHTHSHHHGKEDNAHLWLSFVHPIALATKIASILTIYFPNDKEFFYDNLEIFIKKIEALYLAERIRHKDSADRIRIIQQHSAWDYMLSELGIEQLGVLEEYEGEQPSLKRMNTLLRSVQQQDKNVFLISDSHASSVSSLKKISKETGAKMLMFNPMVSPSGSSEILDILKGYSSLLFAE